MTSLTSIAFEFLLFLWRKFSTHQMLWCCYFQRIKGTDDYFGRCCCCCCYRRCFFVLLVLFVLFCFAYMTVSSRCRILTTVQNDRYQVDTTIIKQFVHVFVRICIFTLDLPALPSVKVQCKSKNGIFFSNFIALFCFAQKQVFGFVSQFEFIYKFLRKNRICIYVPMRFYAVLDC